MLFTLGSFATLLVAIASVSAQGGDFEKAENIIKNGCVCGRTLYEEDFETRRLNALNGCVEQLFGAEKKFRGSHIITEGCPQAAILALQNLRDFSDWKKSSFSDAERNQLDACFYGRLGFRNADGSANPAKIIDELKKAQTEERKRGLASLTKANRETNPEKKAEEMKIFEEATYAFKLLADFTKRASEPRICDQAQVSHHYRCTFNACFATAAKDILI